MLPLPFNVFWKKLRGQFYRMPSLHYLEESKRFTFCFKNQENWEYYTTISKKEIIGFSQVQGIPAEEALFEFKRNYTSAAIQLTSFPQSNEIFNKTIPENLDKSDDDEIDPGEDVIDESEQYGVFFEKVIDGWEKRVLKALDKAELETDQANKSIGEFLQGLFNAINTVPFLGILGTIIRNTMKSGLDSAEEETGVQIGFSENFRKKVKSLENQQLNGYRLPDGKKWHGIKGATDETRIKILKSIEKDVKNKAKKSDMNKHVREIFKGSSVNQAKRITRTETTRFINEAKIMGYKESGIKGLKSWDAVLDNKTSEICMRLEKKYQKGIPFDEPFIDDATGINYMNPPSHVNCRSVLKFVLPPE